MLSFVFDRRSLKPLLVLIEETYCDVDPVIGQDEGGVGSGELRIRHVEICMWRER